MSATGGPLAGLKVIDLSQFILGPVATQILGDMGADVIKVESPRGDMNREIGPQRYPNMAALFLGMNRNKRSIVLDLKRPAALAALMRLVDGADVFVHSMRRQAAERLGIGYEAIAARNPRIVYASAPGFRSDGPHRDRPAYDDVIQGESAIGGINLLATGEQRYLPMAICDKFCGYVLASSIAMALVHRALSGEGQEVQVPMLETMLSFNLIEHLWTGAFDQPQGELGYERALMADRKPFATKDGHICLMATSDEQWQRLLAALDRPEVAKDKRFATLARRSGHFPELYAIVAAELRRRSTAEWQERLDAADVPNGPARTLAELPSDPYLVATKFFHHYVHPAAGPMVTTTIPVHFSRTPGSVRRPPPTLGEHTREVLEEAGYHGGELAEVVGPGRD
jgi:crotonobetainyl-CoA:carnitine CoA-transferase CaiB-like acyl-CoA transferase